MATHGRPPRGTSGALPAYVAVPALTITGGLVYGYFYFQDEAPMTHRKRLIATSPAWERQMGDEQYKQLLSQFRGKILPPDHRASITVKRVGSRIAEAADAFSRKNLSPAVREGAGEFTYTVVRSEDANAFVLPNNHVFVLTGLFKYARDEDELAAVLGHEVAHNLARHAGEKVSGGIVMNLLARLVWLFDPTGILLTLFVPTASLLISLPHSREAEMEADHIGIYLAADACYDPRAAKRVFSAMKEGNGGGTAGGRKNVTPPEFISTHPSYDTRLSNFDNCMSEPLSMFNADGGMKCRRVRDEMKLARKRAAEAAARREGIQFGVSSDSQQRHRPEGFDEEGSPWG